jgi:hypothetical protein
MRSRRPKIKVTARGGHTRTSRVQKCPGSRPQPRVAASRERARRMACPTRSCRPWGHVSWSPQTPRRSRNAPHAVPMAHDHGHRPRPIPPQGIFRLAGTAGSLAPGAQGAPDKPASPEGSSAPAARQRGPSPPAPPTRTSLPRQPQPDGACLTNSRTDSRDSLHTVPGDPRSRSPPVR